MIQQPLKLKSMVWQDGSSTLKSHLLTVYKINYLELGRQEAGSLIRLLK